MVCRGEDENFIVRSCFSRTGIEKCEMGNLASLAILKLGKVQNIEQPQTRNIVLFLPADKKP